MTTSHNDNGLTPRGLFMGDYYEKFKSIFPRPPILHIPGLEVSDETFEWIIEKINSNKDEELFQWAKARYELHLRHGQNNTWAWYVSHPGYSGIWLSSEKVAKEVFEYYKARQDEVFLLHLPVPKNDERIINHHTSINDLILY